MAGGLYSAGSETDPDSLSLPPSLRTPSRQRGARSKGAASPSLAAASRALGAHSFPE